MKKVHGLPPYVIFKISKPKKKSSWVCSLLRNLIKNLNRAMVFDCSAIPLIKFKNIFNVKSNAESKSFPQACSAKNSSKFNEKQTKKTQAQFQPRKKTNSLGFFLIVVGEWSLANVRRSRAPYQHAVLACCWQFVQSCWFVVCCCEFWWKFNGMWKWMVFVTFRPQDVCCSCFKNWI